jgi:hypothetical protein
MTRRKAFDLRLHAVGMTLQPVALPPAPQVGQTSTGGKYE